MQYLLIDGHPAADRLTAKLLDQYQAALPADAQIDRIALRDLKFDPMLHHGYDQPQPWEDDLEKAAEIIDACDHLVVAFPMWWGADPALLKGFLDRILLPHWAYRFREKGDLWDKMLAGRSADALVTMDTPSIFLRLMHKNAIVHRWRGQVFGFCGFKPARFHIFAPVRRGAAEKSMAKWKKRLAKAATSSALLKRAATKESHLAAFREYREGQVEV